MAKEAKIFGQEVILELVDLNIVQIGTGYTVTASLHDDESNLLYSTTVSMRDATFDEATKLMVPMVIRNVSTWLEENE
jgi:hypothetical protein